MISEKQEPRNNKMESFQKSTPVKCLKRSASHNQESMPVPRKSSVGVGIMRKISNLGTVTEPLTNRSRSNSSRQLSRSTKNIEKALDCLKEEEENLQLNTSECDDLSLKLAQYKESPPPLTKKEIFDASIKAYEAYRNGAGALINFHSRIEYESQLFCYMYDCQESGGEPEKYTRHLTLTEYRADYVGFEECGIFRIIYFCSACYELHRTSQRERPNHPLHVKINYAGYKLFSPLAFQ